jgi:hypothetical protein
LYDVLKHRWVRLMVVDGATAVRVAFAVPSVRLQTCTLLYKFTTFTSTLGDGKYLDAPRVPDPPGTLSGADPGPRLRVERL